MSNEIEGLNQISDRIIGCAIEVHKTIGPGLLESFYEKALCREFEINDIYYENQVLIPIVYKQLPLGDYKLDILVEKEIIVELKSVEKLEKVFEAQLLTYLHVTQKKTRTIDQFQCPVPKRWNKEDN